MYNVEFSWIDAKDYPPVILVKDGRWDAEWETGYTAREFIAHKVATNVYLSLVKEAQEKARGTLLHLLEDGTELDYRLLDEDYELDDGSYDLSLGADKFDDLYYT